MNFFKGYPKARSRIENRKVRENGRSKITTNNGEMLLFEKRKWSTNKFKKRSKGTFWTEKCKQN